MKKSQQLLDLMMRNYPHGVSYKRLSLITPAYSQRFGEWKNKGIIITCQYVFGDSYYYLKVHPEAIDLKRIELRQGVLL